MQQRQPAARSSEKPREIPKETPSHKERAKPQGNKTRSSARLRKAQSELFKAAQPSAENTPAAEPESKRDSRSVFF